MLRIGTLVCDAANTKYLARVVNTGLLKIKVDGIALWKGLIGVQVSGRFANGEIDIDSGTGVALAASTGVVFESVTTANYGSATFTSGCANVVGINSALFEATRREVTLPIGGAIYNAGVKVLGSQGVAVADAAGGATVDTEARAALNALLARVRAHGLIAT